MNVKLITNAISREFFQVSLATYLVLALIEMVQQGYISNYFNANYLLVLVVLSGAVYAITEVKEPAWASRRAMVKRRIYPSTKELGRAAKVPSRPLASNNAINEVSSATSQKLTKRRKPASIDGIVRK